MDSININLQNYFANKEDAITEIMTKMEPLLKKYARKIHFMEYEDALQELNLALLEAIKHLDSSNSFGQCVKYITTSIINRYNSLCRHNLLQEKDFDNIPLSDELSCEIPSSFSIDLTAIDFKLFIEKIQYQDPLKGQILSLFYYQQYNDVEIAKKLGVSKQYVNRIKKKLFNEFLSTYQVYAAPHPLSIK